MNRVVLLAGLALFALTPPAAAQQYPAPGKTITMIMPFPAGGGTDVFARQAAVPMAKKLGVPIEIVNKPGASSQVGTSQLAKSQPDGYTLGWVVLPSSAAYLDPDRQSTYTRADLTPIGSAFEVASVVSVLATSPYKNLKDLVDAAKANPGKIKAGTSGRMSTSHFANLGFQRALGIEFAVVNFNGGAPQVTALLGGHIDIAFPTIGEALPHLQARGGQMRVLAVLSDKDHPSGLPTAKAQGFNVPSFAPDVGVIGPKGMSQNVIDVLADALKAATEDAEVKKMMTENGSTLRFLGPKDYAAEWTRIEEKFLPLIEVAKKQAQ